MNFKKKKSKNQKHEWTKKTNKHERKNNKGNTSHWLCSPEFEGSKQIFLNEQCVLPSPCSASKHSWLEKIWDLK